jgi:hypothetical protein
VVLKSAINVFPTEHLYALCRGVGQTVFYPLLPAGGTGFPTWQGREVSVAGVM